MRILQIVPELNIGGVEKTTVELAKFLVENGQDCIVISSGGLLVEELINVGARHIKLPVSKKAPLTIFRMISKVAKIIEEENIDIVHSRSRVPAIIGFFACRKVKKRINIRLNKANGKIEKEKTLFQKPAFITTCHGYYSKHLFSRVMGWGKFVITNSQIISKHMMEDFRVPFERIKLIHRGVDAKIFKFRLPKIDLKDGATIGMVGRLSPIKGHDDFLKAASRVVRIVPKTRVLIVGDVESSKYIDELNLLIRRLGLARYVEFLPTQKDVVSVYRQLDVFVMATKTNEAFGRVLIEAGACGVPVVATRMGGIVDIIKDKKEGLLVPANQPIKMADAIIELLKDRRLAKDMAISARKNVIKRFDLDDMLNKTFEVYKEAQKILGILIIKFGSAGDVILAVPSFRAIRKRFKDARISILIGKKERSVLQDCPYIDEMIVYDRREKDEDIKGFFRILKEVMAKNFDLIIDLQNNSKSHILGFFSFAPYRIGYRRNAKFGFLLSAGIKDLDIPLSPVKHQFRLLNILGISLGDDKLELWPREEDFKYIDELLAKNWLGQGQKFVCINPSASSRWQTKNWGLNKFAKLCDELARQKIRTVIIGSEENISIAKQIAELSKGKPVNFAGKTSLIELACLLKRSKGLVSPDSAPMHIASAMDVPFVALFGPTDPLRHTPPSKDSVIIKKELKCSPCYSPNCQKLTCMKNITVDEVLTAVKKLMIPHT